MSLNLVTILRESVRENADRIAITAGDANLTYRALDDLAQRLAGGLLGLGVRPGQHVALMLPNVPQFSVAYFACHYAACPVVPLNVLLTADEIAYHLDDSDAVALVVWERFLPQVRAALAKATRRIQLIVARAQPGDTSAVDGAHDMAALLDNGERVREMPATRADDTAMLVYTSGTTGRPKGAELTHFGLFYNVECAAKKLLPLSPDTVTLVALPLFHSFGQSVMHHATLRAGGQVVLMPRFEPISAVELVRRHKVTYFGGVPTMYFALLEALRQPGVDASHLESLRFCVAAGSAMPVEIMREFDQRFGVSILEGYGISETSPVSSFNVLTRPKKPGTVGLPIPGVEFRLERLDGTVVTSPGEPGEICICGHNVMKGYYKRPDATAEAIRGGWFHTGDIGVVDDDGYYTIVDRLKDMIIHGGFNVYPREVEETLYAHPAVAEAAVIGVPDPVQGEEIKAVVTLRPGQTATEQEIITFCRERMAVYKYPRIVEFRAELPKGPTGKIMKKELRK